MSPCYVVVMGYGEVGTGNDVMRSDVSCSMIWFMFVGAFVVVYVLLRKVEMSRCMRSERGEGVFLFGRFGVGGCFAVRGGGLSRFCYMLVTILSTRANRPC